MSTKGERTRESILDATEALVLERGFAATSLDDIIKATGLTKGALFHHFDGKGALGRALVERHAREDYEMFEGFAAAADLAADDPLEAMLIFLRLFEDYIRELSDVRIGCIFAIYTYETVQFDPSVAEFVAASLRRWTDLYERRFERLIEVRPPRLSVTAHELAEAIVSIIEGGFVLSRSYNDPHFIARQSRQFRNYLELLFADPAGAMPAASMR